VKYRDSLQLVTRPSCEMSFCPVSISYTPSSVPFAVACQCSTLIAAVQQYQLETSLTSFRKWLCELITAVYTENCRFKYTCNDDNSITHRKQQKLAYHVVTCKFPIISLQCQDMLTIQFFLHLAWNCLTMPTFWGFWYPEQFLFSSKPSKGTSLGESINQSINQS